MDTHALLHLNELPRAPQGGVARAAQGGTSNANRYPDPDARSIRQALAAHYDVPLDWVIAGTGSAGVIHQAMIASGMGEIAFGWPSFDAFPHIAKGLGMPVRLVGLKNNACDLDELSQTLTPKTSIVIICTPNAPTGGVIRHDDLITFLQAAPSSLTVLIDEAYYEFMDDPDAVRALNIVKAYPNVLLTRTFSKAYGLAGLRVGYGIAQPELAQKIIHAGVPFSVPLPAQLAAIEALTDQPRLRRHVAHVTRERNRMAKKLQALGQTVISGHGNFLWLPVGDAAEALAAALREKGVLVKVVPGLGIRITVGGGGETDQLIAAWQNMTGAPTATSQ